MYCQVRVAGLAGCPDSSHTLSYAFFRIATHRSCSKTAFTLPERTALLSAAWSFSFWSA